MESLTRLVSESLARHGFDRPLDYRRLRWSRWFRCESHHSLLFVPSKPGVFALAEEIMDLGPGQLHVGTAPPGCPTEQSSAALDVITSRADIHLNWEGRDFSSQPALSKRSAQKGAEDAAQNPAASAAEGVTDRENRAASIRRMLAVTQFFEDDDMAFILDRMLSHQNPMSARLASGRYFVRFVVIEDEVQRRSICNALNQWIVSAAEKATGIGSHFASSLELTPATEYVPPTNDPQPTLFPDASSHREGHDFSGANTAAQISPALAAEGIAKEVHVGRTLLSANPDTDVARAPSHASAGAVSMTAPHLNSGAATNIHCPSPFPSGF